MGPYLPDTVRQHAVERPDAPAVTEGERTLTYAELNERSNRAAQALLAAGLGEGARVGCLARPGIMSAELLLACGKAGLVATPLNWRLTERELAAVARDAELGAVVTQGEFLPGARAVRGVLPGIPLIVDGEPAPDELAYETWLTGASDKDPLQGGAVHGDTVFLQLYTSGTTGLAKGVQLTLDNVDAGHSQLAEMGWSGRSVGLNAMPVFHIAGTGWLLTGLSAGAHTVTLPDLDPLRAVELMERHRVTHAFFVPAVLHLLTQLPDIRERDFSALEMIVYGASPITPTLLRRSMEIFGCGFLQKYGLTETTGSATRLLPSDHDPDGPRAHLLRSAGNALPDIDVAVVDPVTAEPLASGEVGEIVTRSHQVTPGYWQRPEDNARLFTEDGWLRTGDAGYLDADGYLFITDRIKDMVITGGENVYPVEVESALAEHPDVCDVAVFGTPDETWGEAVTAAVVLNAEAGDVTADDLVEFTRTRIASYKKPRIVHFVEELPRNPSGKFLKRVLRESLGR
ncbi:long-chain-fatty-acid--CoA ligase [Streptomyces antnestii]|uniref:Long-chain-fatty-acid--CoA ligase n=1 Tax=Streptomyces antnestii TaxID=2494256 RepID=A0A437Q0G1_9ACTN|nr:long-chain-fatty-acid--CoA ligase [Streptomyces sp. San01]RVU27955.1 long-chain-fatty-acid--CoA ligase [Streptomyces sp. San01]